MSRPSPITELPPVSREGVEPTQAPELRWIGTHSPVSCLWPVGGLSEELTALNSRHLQEFTDAVAFATRQVLILDPHFDGQLGLPSMWDALEVASDRDVPIWIITNRLRELREWLRVTGRHLPATIEIKAASTPLRFHDRFALVDGDLWHFGSTVGGGYPALSAATHGWGGHVQDFERLFRAWWEP